MGTWFSPQMFWLNARSVRHGCGLYVPSAGTTNLLHWRVLYATVSFRRGTARSTAKRSSSVCYDARPNSGHRRYCSFVPDDKQNSARDLCRWNGGIGAGMRVARKTKTDQEPVLTLNRRLRDLRTIASKLKRSRMTPLQVCEAIIEKRLADRTIRAFFSGLPDDERHYWIANLYALLMPKARRQRLAAYFTPPHLADHAIRAMIDAGIRPGQHRILDPASGGAAFLVPLAARIAESGHKRGARAKTILQEIERTLHGVEIEPGLADLSQALLSDLLSAEIESSGIVLSGLVQRANTLELSAPTRSTTR